MRCPIDHDYDSCQIVGIGNSSYVKIVATSSNKKNFSSSSLKVEAVRKTPGGTFFALVRYLKENQTAGIPYSIINQYLVQEFNTLGDSNPMGVGFISEILTYDPRHDSPKDYEDVLKSLETAPKSLDWTQVWGIIDGLHIE